MAEDKELATQAKTGIVERPTNALTVDRPDWLPQSNEGTEHMRLTSVFFNLPHQQATVPAVGDQTTAVDFTQLPPEECRTKPR